MAFARKNLGQVVPPAGSEDPALTVLYEVPGAASAVVSTVSICNLGSTLAKVRLRHAVAGAAIDGKQYLIYDYPLPPGKFLTYTIGICMATTDVLVGYSDTGFVAFNAWGEEQT